MGFGVASCRIAQSMLHASNITKTRRALQVTVCALYKLLRTCYETDMILEGYREEKCDEQPTFKYWHMIIESVLIHLVLISSFSEGNFDNYYTVGFKHF